MSDVHKVPASAGAEWLMGGFALLRRSPFGFGALGALFGVIAAVLGFAGRSSPGLLVAQQVLMTVAGPLLVAGLVWAAREVDQGRDANPGHLMRGLQEGKAGRLLATLLPQFAVGLVAVVLLMALVGTENVTAMAQAVERAQGQTEPDPSLFAGLPLGRMFLWLLLVVIAGVVAGFFTFTAIPDILFSGSGAFAAMGRSFRACMANLPALLLFFMLLVITAVCLSVAVQLVGVVVKLLLGQTAMLVAMQVLLMAVLMPVVTGAMYLAWKQLFGAAPAVPQAGSGGGVVEA